MTPEPGEAFREWLRVEVRERLFHRMYTERPFVAGWCSVCRVDHSHPPSPAPHPDRGVPEP